MELYIDIIKLFLNKDIYTRYNHVIDRMFLKKNYPEILRMFNTLDILHKKEGSEWTVTDLETVFYTEYPQIDREVYTSVFERLRSAAPKSDLVAEYLDSLAQRAEASKVAFVALDVAEGKVPVSALSDAIANLGDRQTKSSASEILFVDDSLEAIYESTVKGGGLNWRLDSLNRALGPLRKGDFGFIFARPEAGKTTWLADQGTFMATQLKEDDGPILWFNNEERHEKVILRCYEASLGVGLARILADRPRAQAAFRERTHSKLKFIDDRNEPISKGLIERLCKQLSPSLIIVDQLDKVLGFDGDREDLHLGAIYQWHRELAKRYAPVIGVSQSDGSGEGIKFLNMGHVANAKTAKQAEADWILGIGFSYQDPPNVRGFRLCKNKLIGGEQSVAEQRHGQWEVLIQPEIARYVDVA